MIPIETRKPQDAILRLHRARNVLAGLDEEGAPSHPKQSDDDVISFADGEGNRRPHPSVIAKGVAALLDTEISSLEKYFFGKKFHEFDAKIKEMFMREGIEESMARNICISSGTAKLFNAFLHSVSTPGDIFVTAAGYYHSLAGWCEHNKVRLEVVQTRREYDFKLTYDDLSAWYEQRRRDGHTALPRGLILFNPTYTGAVYTRDELSEIADFIAEHDLLVLEDSIFMDTLFDPSQERVHITQFGSLMERSVTLNGGSKAYNLANMRIGWACGAKWMIERMSQYIGVTQGTVPHISKVMALAALNAPVEYLQGNRHEFKVRTQLLVDLVKQANQIIETEVGFRVAEPFLEIAHEPQAGHSMLLSFPALQGLSVEDGTVIHDSIDVTRFFLKEAKVCLSPGLSIGFNDCKARISYACVGLKHTYDEVMRPEIGFILQELLQRLTYGVSMEVLQTMNKDYSNDGNQGFEIGRELIREGILERMVPAMIRLLRQNRRKFS